MVSRLPRRTVAAFATLLGLFMILTAMATTIPAGAANDGQETRATTAQERPDTGKPSAAPTNSPQPKSNADTNPGGANNGGDCGAYCSTRDGSKSGNGEGGGAANGKPCAGCVGKADNKNPPGQRPDATDHNNGYECDGNKGIAKTNPAHTGCKPTPSPTVSPTASETPCVPTQGNPCTPPCVPAHGNPCTPPCVPTEANPCVEPTVLPTATQSPCVPTEDDPCTPPPPCVPTEDAPCVEPTVLPTTVVSPSPSVSPSVKGVKINRPVTRPRVEPGALPTTGSTMPVALLLALGIGLVATGVGMTVTSSRR